MTENIIKTHFILPLEEAEKIFAAWLDKHLRGHPIEKINEAHEDIKTSLAPYQITVPVLPVVMAIESAPELNSSPITPVGDEVKNA